MFYYFGFYKSDHIKENCPSGNINAISFKMDYIIQKIKEAEIPFTVVSSYLSEKTGYYPYKRVEEDKSQVYCYLPTLRTKGLLQKLTGLFKKLMVFFFFLFTLKKNDTILAYHDPINDGIFVFLKKLKGFKLILEVEEVLYCNSKAKNQSKIKKKEEKTFKAADAYIIVNDIIYEKYLDTSKPYMVIYGAYDTSIKTKFAEKYSLANKDKINVLFSGSIDKVRGAHLAVKTAEHLTDKYVLNISGFGNPVEMAELEQSIEQHNKSGKGSKIVMHGQLTADELDKLAYSCDIGLNLQDINNPFEAVSYPSKISFYLLHGLNVVSTKMSSVLASKLSEHLYYCDMEPESVAKTIMSIEAVSPKENFDVICKLDEDTAKEVRSLLYGNN